LFSPTQAVVPPPDACYPNYTTAEGCDALSFLTTGAGNTGLGWYSLFLNAAGTFNTGVGAGTLRLNTADGNTATGAGACLQEQVAKIQRVNDWIELTKLPPRIVSE
jgi:hypothetical protein